VDLPVVADVVGIGFGPANVALAIAIEELCPDLRPVFLERHQRPCWQPGMLLDGSDIQHNPARDLATPRNPRSRYTFLNYLFEEGRLFEFLNLGIPYPLRKDYAHYVVWAAEQFADQVRYGTVAERVEPADVGGRQGVAVRLRGGRTVLGQAAVVAPGRAPNLPPAFRGVSDPRVFHFTDYLDRIDELAALARPRLAVVGGSQSAVELVLDASRRLPHGTVTNVLRGFGYRQKDLSPFTNEVYFPGFVDYYYEASEASRRDLDRQLHFTNYSAADMDVIQALYVQLYEGRLDGDERVRLIRNADVVRCRPEPDAVRLDLVERHRATTCEIEADGVVLATGFLDLTVEHGPQFLPDLLEPVAGLVSRTQAGHAAVGRDYRLLAADEAALPPVYLNGLCETSHGMGDAGSFSLLSLRAATIAESLLKALAKEPERRP